MTKKEENLIKTSEVKIYKLYEIHARYRNKISNEDVDEVVASWVFL